MLKSTPLGESPARLVGRAIRRIKAGLRANGAASRQEPGEVFSRSQYKAVWNAVSTSEDGAKLAVSGYTDENIYRETAEYTLDKLQRSVGVGKDDVVLEIGAGVGRTGAAVAPVCREWIGTDVSENMVAHMKRRLAAFGNVRAVVTNGFVLAPIPSGSVDVVYCTVVFMHLEDWERYGYVLEGFRVLRPGGRMFVDNVNLLSDEGWAFFEQHRAIPPEDRPPQISRTSTPQELETYFRRAGFCDIQQAPGTLWLSMYARKPAPVAQ